LTDFPTSPAKDNAIVTKIPMTKITEIALGILNSLAFATKGLQIMAINKESKKGTKIFAAVLMPAKIIKSAAMVTNTFTTLACFGVTPINNKSLVINILFSKIMH